VTHRLLAPALALAFALGLTVGVAGCGSDSDDSSTTSSSPTQPTSTGPAPAEVCDALDKLVADVKSLQDDDTLQEYKTDIDAAIVDFREFKNLAVDAYADDVDTFEQALTDFADQVKSFGNGQGAMQSLEDLGAAAGNLDDAATTLVEQIPCAS
jgi:hypothetical protein